MPIHTYIHIYKLAYASIHTSLHTYIHTYNHTYNHTYIHTYYLYAWITFIAPCWVYHDRTKEDSAEFKSEVYKKYNFVKKLGRFVYLDIHIYVSMYVCMHVCIHAYIYIYICVCWTAMFVYLFVYICIYAYMLAWDFIYVVSPVLLICWSSHFSQRGVRRGLVGRKQIHWYPTCCESHTTEEVFRHWCKHEKGWDRERKG